MFTVHNYHLSTTYLKLLLHEPEMVQMLENVTGGQYHQWFEHEFVAGSDIQPVFEAFARAGVESWIMKFGDHLDSTTHGPLGFTALSSPNLRTALRVLADYSCIRTTAYSNELEEDEYRLTIIANRQIESGLVSRWLIEASMKVAQRLIESLMTHSIGDHASVSFTHEKPRYADQLEAYFGIPCTFNATQNAFSIPASWGDITSPLADTGAFKTNLAKCRELKLKLGLGSNLLDSVNVKLESFFNDCRSGHTTPTHLPTLNRLAQEFALSPRTLARRLSDQGSSYKQALESTRHNQAKELLNNTHLRIADIADCLAYNEPANFIRAFKQWEGTTPSQWRRKTHSQQTQPMLKHGGR